MLTLAIPVIPVTDVVRAEQFYCEGLGFRLNSTYRSDPERVNPAYLSLERDGIWLHVDSFSAAKAGNANAFFCVRDADAFYAEITGRGVEVPNPPWDQTWGNREVLLKDPDGNGLCFAQVGAARKAED